MDGHVDANAEGVGTADDGQQALLGELLDEQAVAGQQARVVQADAAGDEVLERLAEGGGEAAALDGLLDRLALFLAGDAVARQRTRALKRRILGEMHDVEGRVALAQRQLDRALEAGLDVLVGKRDGARGVGDDLDVAPGVALEGVGDGRGVAQGGAHEHELGVGQREQRHLPGPSAIGVGEEVEFVHGHHADIGVLALAQRLVGQDLGGAADDGGARVDVRVAGDHAHVVTAEYVDQVEEFLAHQRLDGRGVVAALAGRHGHEHHADRHERFARARVRAQDHVAARGEREQGFLLMRPGFDAARFDPFEEALVRGFEIEPGFGLLAFCRFPPARGERAERSVGGCVEFRG